MPPESIRSEYICDQCSGSSGCVDPICAQKFAENIVCVAIMDAQNQRVAATSAGVRAVLSHVWESGLQPTLAGVAVYGGSSRSKCRALFALDALGQVFGASLLRNAVAPSIADPNS